MKLTMARNVQSVLFAIAFTLCGIYFHWLYFLVLLMVIIFMGIELWKMYFNPNRPISGKEFIFAKQKLSHYLEGRFVGTTRELIKLTVRDNEYISINSLQAEIENETALGQKHIRRVARLLRKHDNSFEKIESIVFNDLEFKVCTDDRGVL